MELIFLSAQATYAHVHIALFKDNLCIDTISQQGVQVSSHLIPYFDEILMRNDLSLKDLAFIAVDRGPGAFTSLRTSVATVNGIGITHKVAIIGINSLDAFIYDVTQAVMNQMILTKPVSIIALLNAYNDDVYYAITQVGQSHDFKQEIKESGYKKIGTFLTELGSDILSEQIIFAGNGAMLHQELILGQLEKNKVSFIQQETPSAQSIGILALEHYHKDNTPCYRIEPNYVKSQYFAVQRPFNVPQI